MLTKNGIQTWIAKWFLQNWSKQTLLTCGNFGSAWNRGRLLSVPFESDVTVQFWFCSSWFSIHCCVGPRIDKESSSVSFRPAFFPLVPTPLRNSDKLSRMGLAPSPLRWSTSLEPLSRSPQSRVKSEILLELSYREEWWVVWYGDNIILFD